MHGGTVNRIIEEETMPRTMKITDAPMVCPTCKWIWEVGRCEAGDDGVLMCPKCRVEVIRLRKYMEMRKREGE